MCSRTHAHVARSAVRPAHLRCLIFNLAVSLSCCNLHYNICRANPLCSCAPCRLDPRCTDLSGLHGIWRKLPSQPQYWHAAQVCSSHRTDFNFSVQFLLQVFQVFYPLVCRCYEMERRLKTPDLFKFPYFEAICWYVAKNLLEMLKGESQTFYLTYRSTNWGILVFQD